MTTNNNNIGLPSTFIHPTVTRGHEAGCEPTYLSLRPLLAKLNANDASVSSDRGDGRLGLAYLTLGQAGYQFISHRGFSFVPFVNPKPNLVIPPDATQAKIN